MTPEQVQDMKIDNKAAELQQTQALRNDPSMLSPMDALRQQLMPQRPRLKPIPTMTLLSNNGQLLGDGKSS